MQTASDPFANLEELVKKQVAEERAIKGLGAARTELLLGGDARSAFFAMLGLRFSVEMNWQEETMATDGRRLLVNPEWFNALSHQERVGTLVHEILHVVGKHHVRREGREPSTWNQACDCSANQILEEAGFTLPEGRLMPGEGKHEALPKGLSAEEYYSLLKTESPEPSGPADLGGCGRVIDCSDPAEAADLEAEWDCAVAQAEHASRTRGTLPGGLARLVGEVLSPPADWREILRQFLTQFSKGDYSWSQPNRRFINQGLYLPGLRSQELGDVVIAVDTSGSIGEREMDLFSNEAEAILNAHNCSATILYHDVSVTKKEEWKSTDGPLKLEPEGGGGTSHVELFQHIDAMERLPSVVLCLTDLFTTFPAETPDVPVLWAVIGGNESRPPFGDVIHVGD